MMFFLITRTFKVILKIFIDQKIYLTRLHIQIFYYAHMHARLKLLLKYIMYFSPTTTGDCQLMLTDKGSLFSLRAILRFDGAHEILKRYNIMI